MTAVSRTHPQTLIAEAPISRMQLMTIAICVLINMLDGFDVLAIAYTAPLISEAWGIGPGQLGVVFSAGGAGMILGALALGPMADYKGRRFVVVIGVLIITVGMLATTFVQSLQELILARLFTGIGIGALLASLNTLVAEYSPARYRNISITLLHLGYPVGAAIGGVISAALLSRFGWQSVFLVGGLVSLVLLPACILVVPESVDYLLVRRGNRALKRLNQIMGRMGYDPLTELPEAQNQGADDSLGFRRLLSRDLLLPNLLMPIAFFMIMTHLYFVLQWMPKLTAELGHSLEQGIQVSVLLSVTAAAGMLLFGLAATKFSLTKVVIWLSFAAATAMMLLGFFASGPYSLLLILVAVVGLVHSGLTPGLYALAPRLFPAAARARRNLHVDCDRSFRCGHWPGLSRLPACRGHLAGQSDDAVCAAASSAGAGCHINPAGWAERRLGIRRVKERRRVTAFGERKPWLKFHSESGQLMGQR